MSIILIGSMSNKEALFMNATPNASVDPIVRTESFKTARVTTSFQFLERVTTVDGE